MYFDTHAHTLHSKFDSDRATLYDTLFQNGVSLLLEAGTDVNESRQAQALAAKHAYVYFSAGIHPHEAKDAAKHFEDELAPLLRDEKCVAVGEAGLDFHYDFSPRDIQRDVFARQLALAKTYDLPIVVHDRETQGACIDLLTAHRGVKGVLHSFSGDLALARRVLDLGLYLSFSGVVTYKQAEQLQHVAMYAPADRILCETDSPYLTPVPDRGKRNDPSKVALTIAFIAKLRGTPLEKFAHVTKENGKRLFAIEAQDV